MDQQPRKRLLYVKSRINGVWDVRHAGTTSDRSDSLSRPGRECEAAPPNAVSPCPAGSLLAGRTGTLTHRREGGVTHD